MAMAMDTALVVGGLAILLIGGEALLRGATALARRLGLSTLVIGLTVVAFGTSAPELVVSVTSVAQGNPGLATGSVVGSNIANILLILGIGALMRPIACALRSVFRDGVALLAATALFTGFAFTGAFEPGHGAALLAALVAFILWSFMGERRVVAAAANPSGVALAPSPPELPAMRTTSAVALVAVGCGALFLGATWLIDGAVAIARAFAVSETTIGLTLIAVGTSLPELAAAVIASLRRDGDLLLGNVIGSNVFNCLAVMGAAALAGPVPVDAALLRLDIWIMAAATLLLIPVMATGWRISRAEGAVLLVLYAAFLASHA